MATEAQIKANRENAKKSTGPRTAEGKRTAAQNALKHGLFGREKTIHGESNEEYDRHHQAFIDELEPATMVESALAERIVTLSWRLRRAERMENQVTDVLTIRCGGEWPDMDMVLAIPHEVRKEMVDATTLGRDMCLGQAAVRDFSYFRVIEKVTLYARRMETNLIKTMKELKKLQTERRTTQVWAAERQATEQIAPAETNTNELKKRTQSPASGRKSKARNPKPETHEAQTDSVELKKRTQLGAARRCVSAFAKDNYDACRNSGQGENLGGQSRSQADVAESQTD